MFNCNCIYVSQCQLLKCLDNTGNSVVEMSVVIALKPANLAQVTAINIGYPTADT